MTTTTLEPQARSDTTVPYLNMDGTKIMYHPRRLADWLEGQDIFPLHVDVGTNNSCNYRCRHCYLGHLGHQRHRLDADVLMNLMRSFGRVGVKSIFIAGSGEPLLNPATVEGAAEARKAGVDVSMATNGRLMTAEIAERMVPVLRWVRFSMQGGDAQSYARLHRGREEDFHAVCRNLAHLCAVRDRLHTDCSIGVMTCLMPGNEKEAPLLARIAKDSGADYYTVRPPSINAARALDCPVWDQDELAEQFDAAEAMADERFSVIVRRNLFRDQTQRDYRQCLGLPFLTQVDGDGGVYTCGVFVGDPNCCYGNLNEQTFEEIWQSPRRRRIMKRVIESGEFGACDNLCRLHNINKYLWQLKNPPDHVNFI